MVIFTGDVYLNTDRLILEDNLISLLNQADLIVSNFENVLENKELAPRVDKFAILSFKQSQFERFINQFKSNLLLTLGNNHISDLGEEGLNQTKSFLKTYPRCESTGAGNIDEVRFPLVKRISSKDIAFLPASCDDPEVMSIISSHGQSGILDMFDSSILEIITSIKRSVDYLVMLPHWGREYVKYPEIKLRKLAYKWIDSGADLVIGTHPHQIQGREQYRGKWIYYSLGNCIFPEFYLKNGIRKCWPNYCNKSCLVKVDFTQGIAVNEVGVSYSQKKNLLSLDPISVEYLKDASYALDTKTVGLKEYYNEYQLELYKSLRNEYSLTGKIRKFASIKHKDESKLKFLFKKIARKITKKNQPEK